MARNKKKTAGEVQADIIESLGDGSAKSASPQLEKKIIAACFHRKPTLDHTCNNLAADAFSDPRYRVFFKYILEVYSEGKLPDVDVCLARAKRSTELDIDPEDYDEGMRSALNSGADCDVEQVCHQIQDLYVARRMMALANRISANAMDGVSSAELVGQAEQALEKLTGEVVRDNSLMNIDELIESSPRGIDEVLDPPMDGIPSPWPSLNEYIYGFRPKQVTVVGARPSTGKTAVLLEIALHAAKMGKVVPFFSHEMPAFDLWTRIFCHECGIKSSDFMHRQLTEKEKQAVRNYIQHEAPRGLIITDRGGRTTLSMKSSLARVRHKYGALDMVGIDYIQLMKSPDRNKDRRVEVGDISNEIKRMSLDLNASFVVAAQLNRMMDNRPGDLDPKLSDLRESGDIEQDADLVIFPHRPSILKKPKEGIPPPPDEFIIAKNRRGRTGRLKMRYNGEYYAFKEMID